jgi:hypothetical protein
LRQRSQLTFFLNRLRVVSGIPVVIAAARRGGRNQTAFGCLALEVVPQSAGATLEEEQYHDVRKKVGDEATANLEALDFCS